MTTRTIITKRARKRREALVWIDHDQAVIVEQRPNRPPAVEVLVREPAEEVAAFEGRTVGQVIDKERVLVSGPGHARTDFERAFVAVTHRPDLLVDVEPSVRTPRTRKHG